ncbi:MAG: hypothetical protein IPK82_08465 [Polyangiaceae bacterium]|nr:hypothetical protein [Polyangiaceae bacterium]
MNSTYLTFSIALLPVVLLACDGENTSGSGGSGGTPQGGSTSSGAAGSVGNQTGGSQTGGSNTGGANTGGNSGGTGGMGGGFIPDPIPTLDEEPPAPCQKAIDTPDYFQFLDNLCDEKKVAYQPRSRQSLSIGGFIPGSDTQRRHGGYLQTLHRAGGI